MCCSLLVLTPCLFDLFSKCCFFPLIFSFNFFRTLWHNFVVQTRRCCDIIDVCRPPPPVYHLPSSLPPTPLLSPHLPIPIWKPTTWHQLVNKTLNGSHAPNHLANQSKKKCFASAFLEAVKQLLYHVLINFVHRSLSVHMKSFGLMHTFWFKLHSYT